MKIKYNFIKMIQPKIQEVYFPVKSDELSICALDKNGEWKYQDIDVIKKELITFTPQEFEEYKREFGSKLLEKVIGNIEYEDIPYTNCMECGNSETIVVKNSILQILEPFLNENKI